MKEAVINKEKLNAIAEPLTSLERERMDERRRNRYWRAASSAIAAKIRRKLQKLNMSQTELAELLGITPANVTRYLSGRTNFELKTLIEIERAIGLHIIDRTVVPEEELLPSDDSSSSVSTESNPNGLTLNVSYKINLFSTSQTASGPERWSKADSFS